MDSGIVSTILDTAEMIERSGLHRRTDESLVLGKMFHNASFRENQIVDLTAARLGFSSVDLSWKDMRATETSILYDEVRMASEAVDILVTAISNTETFGEGRDLSTKFPEYSNASVVSLHDDVYHWQSALAHMLGFKKKLGSPPGKQIVITWTYGSTFTNPSIAHALMMIGVLSEANVRIVAPSDFPLLGRVRRDALKSITSSDVKLEFSADFENAFLDADAIFPLNWFRLDNFNHPERNQQYANKYKDWFLRQELLPQDYVLSTEPDIQSDLSISSELLRIDQNVSSSWLSRRVLTLASTILYILDRREHGASVSLV